MDTRVLVGRQRQRAVLGQWVDALAVGQGRAVLVEGEAGIGKSSLARHLADRAELAGCQVFWADCDELSEAFPLRPLMHALDVLASSSGGPRMAEQLYRRAGAGHREDLVAGAVEQFLEVVERASAAAPAMLIVDDIQWADAVTVMTVGRLRQLVTRVPLLLVCLGRPLPQRTDLAALRRNVPSEGVLRLRGLTATEVAALVTEVVDGTPSTGLMRLAEGAGGNPLYLTELLAALKRSRALVKVDGRVEVTSTRIPESLSAAIADRLGFLAEPVGQMLRTAALLGVTFSVSELVTVTGRSVVDLRPLLEEAFLAGVLRDAGSDLAFRHPLIHAALYQAMPAAVRAAWHREAARTLAEAGAPVNRVAHQLLPACGADDPVPDEWTVRWLAEIAQRLAGIAPNATVRLMRWALRAAPPQSELHDVLICRLADALYRAGDDAAAAQLALAALVRINRTDLMVELHSTLTQCRALTGRSEESLTALQSALRDPDATPAQRARLLVLVARAHRFLGHVDEAGRAAEQALAAAEDSGDRWAAAWALSVLANVCVVRGEQPASLRIYDQALAVAADDPALADLNLLLLINKAVTLGDLDRQDQAIDAAEQVRELAEQAANAVRLSQAHTALAELLFDVGRWDDSMVHVRAVASSSKDPVSQCIVLGAAVIIRLHRGDRAAADDLAEVEQHAATRIGGRIVGSLALARSLNLEQAGTSERALAVLLEALADPVEEVAEGMELLPDAVRLALRTGDDATAGTLTARAQAAAADSPEHSFRQAIAWHCQGLLDGAPEGLLRAAEHYRAAGRPLPRAQALEAAGVAQAEQNNIADARGNLSAAYAHYTDLGAAWDLQRVQGELRLYSIRRGPSPAEPRVRHGWESLTPAEATVAGLLAKGLTNPQIAAELFISRRTVQSHVASILSKLGLRSRIEVAREASRRNDDQRSRDD